MSFIKTVSVFRLKYHKHAQYVIWSTLYHQCLRVIYSFSWSNRVSRKVAIVCTGKIFKHLFTFWLLIVWNHGGAPYNLTAFWCLTLSLKESFIRHAAYLEGSRSEKRDVCVARESKRCSEASARSVTGGDSKWIAVQPQRPLLGRLCNKRGPGSLSA